MINESQGCLRWFLQPVLQYFPLRWRMQREDLWDSVSKSKIKRKTLLFLSTWGTRRPITAAESFLTVWTLVFEWHVCWLTKVERRLFMWELHKNPWYRCSVKVLHPLIVESSLHQFLKICSHWFDEDRTWQNWLYDLLNYRLRLKETCQLTFIKNTTSAKTDSIRQVVLGRIEHC